MLKGQRSLSQSTQCLFPPVILLCDHSREDNFALGLTNHIADENPLVAGAAGKNGVSVLREFNRSTLAQQKNINLEM